MQELESLLRTKLDLADADIEILPVHGGDIHRSFAARYCLPDQDTKSVFIKQNDLSHSAVLESEFSSLQRMVNEYGLDYPRPIGFYQSEQACYLLMAFHRLGGGFATISADKIGAELGEMLAQQHKIFDSQFGWMEDNFIGLTPQPNKHCDQWVEFYRERRLESQLSLARNRGLSKQLNDGVVELMNHLEVFFHNYEPQPSLLHGDLWSGNFSIDLDTQKPLLFDPAPYFGDREADIAMTELFGGFPAGFYTAYQQHFPLHEGYERRKPLYNLYHALNHFNLFGSGYAGMVGSLLSEMKRHY